MSTRYFVQNVNSTIRQYREKKSSHINQRCAINQSKPLFILTNISKATNSFAAIAAGCVSEGSACADEMGPARKKGARSRLVDEIYTCCAFWIAVSALPALAISYVGKISSKLYKICLYLHHARQYSTIKGAFQSY